MGKPLDIKPKSLEELLRERDELLSNCPQLRPLQAEIDDQLAKVGNDPQKRIQVVLDMLKDIIVNEYEPAMRELEEVVEEQRKLRLVEMAMMPQKNKKVSSD